jgi:hypothetical protein
MAGSRVRIVDPRAAASAVDTKTADGRDSFPDRQLAGLAAFCIALAITTGSIELLHGLLPGASRVIEVAVLVAANGLATAVRFLALRLVLALVVLPGQGNGGDLCGSSGLALIALGQTLAFAALLVAWLLPVARRPAAASRPVRLSMSARKA